MSKDMNANKVIHEAMGLCWCKETTFDCMADGHCPKCGEFFKFPINPDYTDPVHYCALMDWMREKVGRHDRQRLLLFVQYMESRGVEAVRVWGQSIEVQVTLITEAIEAGVLT